MSKELLNGYDITARKIQHFMYEGRPRRSRKKEHTVEECMEFLEELRMECWNNYNGGLRYLERRG